MLRCAARTVSASITAAPAWYARITPPHSSHYLRAFTCDYVGAGTNEETAEKREQEKKRTFTYDYVGAGTDDETSE
jgi:microcompartment protein CcmK/EutM